ncbi:MAG: Uma2 family endonuclease [Chloroflexi bacterium]|nr:Uma2 family endonuclease [Chloroflexota bacterium]
MELRQRVYDVDDLWELGSQEGYRAKDYELIDGAIIEMTKPGGRHGQLVIRLGRYLDIYVEENRLGYVTTETAYFHEDHRYTVLAPDLAFIARGRAPDPFPDKWIPSMPDLAVEVRSPSNSIGELREKAQIYLRHGTTLVWIIIPGSLTVEVWRMQEDGSFTDETLEAADALSGEDVLPGFQLGLGALFA